MNGTMVVSNGGTVTRYGAADGKQVWEMTGLMGNTIPSAAVVRDSVIVAAGENRQQPDADGTSQSNCKRTLGGKNGYAVAWRAQKLVAGTVSPVVHTGHAYFNNKSGGVVCLDEATGEEKYRERLDNQQ